MFWWFLSSLFPSQHATNLGGNFTLWGNTINACTHSEKCVLYLVRNKILLDPHIFSVLEPDGRRLPSNIRLVSVWGNLIIERLGSLLCNSSQKKTLLCHMSQPVLTRVTTVPPLHYGIPTMQYWYCFTSPLHCHVCGMSFQASKLPL